MRLIIPQRNMTSLAVEESEIEEVFNFEEYLEVEEPVTLDLEIMRLKYLMELRHICRGPKQILSLHNLGELEIESCPKLRVVFSASMSKFLPQLSHLRIKDCPELLHLIEEDDGNYLNQQRCFPKLQYIDIEQCDSLKCLFPISTLGMLPSLRRLQIVDAMELEQVFTCKQDDIIIQKKMAVQDVFPTLSCLILKGLPLLVTVYGNTNFQTVKYVDVVDCPNYEGLQDGDSDQEMPDMGETSASPNFAEGSSLKEKVEQDFQELHTSKEAIQTTDSESRKQSIAPLFSDTAKTAKETRDEKLPDDVIPSLHHQSQIGSASPSSSALEIAEILEAVACGVER